MLSSITRITRAWARRPATGIDGATPAPSNGSTLTPAPGTAEPEAAPVSTGRDRPAQVLPPPRPAAGGAPRRLGLARRLCGGQSRSPSPLGGQGSSPPAKDPIVPAAGSLPGADADRSSSGSASALLRPPPALPEATAGSAPMPTSVAQAEAPTEALTEAPPACTPFEALAEGAGGQAPPASLADRKSGAAGAQTAQGKETAQQIQVQQASMCSEREIGEFFGQDTRLRRRADLLAQALRTARNQEPHPLVDEVVRRLSDDAAPGDRFQAAALLGESFRIWRSEPADLSPDHDLLASYESLAGWIDPLLDTLHLHRPQTLPAHFLRLRGAVGNHPLLAVLTEHWPRWLQARMGGADAVPPDPWALALACIAGQSRRGTSTTQLHHWLGDLVEGLLSLRSPSDWSGFLERFTGVLGSLRNGKTSRGQLLGALVDHVRPGTLREMFLRMVGPDAEDRRRCALGLGFAIAMDPSARRGPAMVQEVLDEFTGRSGPGAALPDDLLALVEAGFQTARQARLAPLVVAPRGTLLCGNCLDMIWFTQQIGGLTHSAGDPMGLPAEVRAISVFSAGLKKELITVFFSGAIGQLEPDSMRRARESFLDSTADAASDLAGGDRQENPADPLLELPLFYGAYAEALRQQLATVAPSGPLKRRPPPSRLLESALLAPLLLRHQQIVQQEFRSIASLSPRTEAEVRAQTESQTEIASLFHLLARSLGRASDWPMWMRRGDAPQADRASRARQAPPRRQPAGAAPLTSVAAAAGPVPRAAPDARSSDGPAPRAGR